MNKKELKLDDFELDEIESIELLGEEDTIDITVKDTHMFYANDIYTHNSSIKAEVVESDQMGGSIKRGQIGHFIISVAKSLTQKEEGTATLAILKSRFGKDGIIFYDVIFDNGLINIDVSEGNNNGFGMSMLDAQKNKEAANQQLVNDVLKKKRDIMNGETK